MKQKINIDNIHIVLIEPQIPENIGAVARAMSNMGVKHLILVKPKNLDLQRIHKTATGHSTNIIDKITVKDNILDAISPFQYLAGTTARTGSSRPAMTDPRRLAGDLIPISVNNPCAILFGPEDRGLSNEHLRYCHTIVTIPTSEFWSLNLAQAVMIICYEIYLASREPMEETVPRLANRFELEGMYGHAKDVLKKIGFLNPQNPEHWMMNVRRLCNRFPLRAKEVRTIRGICRQIDWYTGQKEKPNDKKSRDDPE